MSYCPVNKGKHAFYTSFNTRDERVGNNTSFKVCFWHTCISCGERRATTDWGELIIKIDGDWEVQENE